MKMITRTTTMIAPVTGPKTKTKQGIDRVLQGKDKVTLSGHTQCKGMHFGTPGMSDFQTFGTEVKSVLLYHLMMHME